MKPPTNDSNINSSPSPSSSIQPITHDLNGLAYLVAIKCGKEIVQRIIVAKDVFDIEKKVRESFKNIEWWEIRCNYGIVVY